MKQYKQKNRQRAAAQRLETQLKEGTKTVKGGTKQVELTAADEKRIERTIQNLEGKNLAFSPKDIQRIEREDARTD